MSYKIVILGFLTMLCCCSGVTMNGACKSSEKIDIYNAMTGKIEKVNRICKTDEEWRQLLTPEQFRVMRQKGTEQPFGQSCGSLSM